MRRSAFLLTAVVLMALSFASTASAAPGQLDPSFDGDGKLTTDLGSGGDIVFDVAIQPDGKIVAAGYGHDGFNVGFSLARYNPGGSLASTFGGDGLVATDFASSTDYAYALALQPDGKIVVAGRSGDDFALARYRSNGSLDSTFDEDGKLTTDFGPTPRPANSGSQADDLVVQPDGKIVAAGYASDGTNIDFALARYNSDGSLDTAFDQDGKLTTDFGSSGSDFVYGLALQPDGKIVAAGGGANDFALARYNPDGGLDTGFDGDGKLTTSLSTSEQANDVAIQPDGKIVAAGYAYNSARRQYDFALARYSSDGSPDTGFDEDGTLTTSFSQGSQYANSLALQPNGKLVVAGKDSSNADDFALARYNPDGGLDAGFDGDGKLTTNFGSASGDEANAVALQPDGKIVVAGRSGERFALARYLGGDPTPPESTGQQTVAAGDTLSTDDEGDGATDYDPVETSITSPVEGTVSVTETAAITEQPTGYSLLGQQANIEAPPSTADNPLTFVFVLDSSLLPTGEDQNTIQVFRNGVQVQNCTDQSGIAEPDPCVLSRELLADGDVKFTVLTSHASAWNFGVVDDVAPTVTVAPRHLATGVSPTVNVTATFSEAMKRSTLNGRTFYLVKKGTTRKVAATLKYPSSNKVVLDPGDPLTRGATYVATITTGVKDLAGNALATQKVWRFTVK